MSLADNYKRIEELISAAAQSSGRNSEDIELVAVSKTISTNIIQEAIDSGIRLFGENRIQEAKNKISQLNGDYSFHLIGHLQSNKSKDAVKLFNLIHSIDKISTAIKVNSEAEKINKVQKILIQVNSSGENTKNGVEPEETINFVRRIAELNNIEVLGLMTMAPFTDNSELIRKSFRLTKIILDKINDELNLNLKELSMGMSQDFELAIKEGATMVRVGTAIFGERK
ncbi:YggS family pyridoxal phosphate-dependent enzyme [Spirochaetota bacterium]